MGYAIKAYLTEEAAEPIKKIWQDIAEAGLGDFLVRSQSRPGITLAVWENLPVSKEIELIRLVESFSELRISPFQVETYGVTTFPTDPSHVFLGVVPSTAVLSFHQIFHGVNMKLTSVCEEYYKPGNWVPHSTLSLRCEREQIIPIMEICLKHQTRLTGGLRSVGLVETSAARQIIEAKFEV